MIQEMSAAVQHLHTDCINCSEAIFNPLCPTCLFEEFKAFIARHPSIDEQLSPKVIRFLRAHKSFSKDSQTCVACGKNRTYLCPYCFTEYLFNLLKEEGVGPKVLGEFLVLFNFDFEHYGYYKEGEALGVF